MGYIGLPKYEKPQQQNNDTLRYTVTFPIDTFSKDPFHFNICCNSPMSYAVLGLQTHYLFIYSHPSPVYL